MCCSADGDPYACVLNQTDLGQGTIGKNSFYKMQILKLTNRKNTFVVYNRWGRVGSEGNKTEKEYSSVEDAVKVFVPNFYQKTGNTWTQYVDGTFAKATGRFYPVEMDGGEDSDDDDSAPADTSNTKLEAKLANFLRLIFDQNTILTMMKELNIDTKKLPLGKISATRVAQGYACLEAIEAELELASPKNAVLSDKSNQFYTLIPHDFGDGTKPAAICTKKAVKEKYELLNVLGDIEVAAGILKSEKKSVDPLMNNYKQLDCEMETLDQKSKEFKIIETFTENTLNTAAHCSGWCMGSNIPRKILQVFKVNRKNEGAAYKKEFDKVGNKRLLWHGTNPAVVAAILKGGLRIMPHSGGRVGKGIYLASENNKSAAYVQAAKDPHNNDINTGLMFLVEGAIGKPSEITSDNSSLQAAPTGFDSVLALGQSEPDPSQDTTLIMDGHPVTVAQGLPIKNPALKGKSSNFTQSEYLVYKESQVRIRYVLTLQWGSR